MKLRKILGIIFLCFIISFVVSSCGIKEVSGTTPIQLISYLPSDERAVKLSWNNVDCDEFKIYKSLIYTTYPNSLSSSDAWPNPITTLPSSVTYYSDRQVFHSSKYIYEVYALKGEEIVAESRVEVNTPVLSLSLNLKFTSSNSALLSWKGEGATSYKIFRKGESSEEVLLADFPSDATYYQDGDLQSGTYCWLVRAESIWGKVEKEVCEEVDYPGYITECAENDVVCANNQFALEFYSELKKEYKDENIFFSPFSIFTALAMTYEGARGQTAEEMQGVLHIPENPDLRRQDIAKIINEINKPDKKYKLSTANALWPSIDFRLLEEYQNTIETYYGGRVTSLDYAGDPEGSRNIINKWVEDQTESKIKDIIPQNSLNEYTALVLTNAIYFKGIWVLQFDPQDTKDEDFRTASGEIVKVPMMRLTGEDVEFKYAETDKVQILEMPYEGEEISMLIILPKEDNLENIEEILTPEKLSEWKNMLKEQRVDVYIPRFKIETKYFLKTILSEMGMPTAFSLNADLSGIGISENGNISINNVIHQAYVEVNEEGTEAAAATAIIIIVTSYHPPPPVFRADHPFIFIIQQKDNGNILFLGRFNKP